MLDNKISKISAQLHKRSYLSQRPVQILPYPRILQLSRLHVCSVCWPFPTLKKVKKEASQRKEMTATRVDDGVGVPSPATSSDAKTAAPPAAAPAAGVNVSLMTKLCWAGLVTIAFPANTIPIVVVAVRKDLGITAEQIGRCVTILTGLHGRLHHRCCPR